jgi:triosephosphate isomerase
VKPLIAGNWKMFGRTRSLDEIETLIDRLDAETLTRCDVAICPPATLVAAAVQKAAGSGIAIGGQDCHAETEGAHTGCISAEMLADAGATLCIVGHSECRAAARETDDMVRAKAEAARRAGLTPIVCIGESLEVREAGRAIETVRAQLEGSLPAGEGKLIVAYEPIWAIGTGRTPQADDIVAMHAALREVVGPQTRLLYGGSVKGANAADILSLDNVNGALVGGASLSANDFHPIIKAA